MPVIATVYKSLTQKSVDSVHIEVNSGDVEVGQALNPKGDFNSRYCIKAFPNGEGLDGAESLSAVLSAGVPCPAPQRTCQSPPERS